MEILSIQTFKLIQVILLSGIKFLFAPALSMGYGYNFLQTFIFTTLGGVLGLIFFYYLSKWIITQYYVVLPVLKQSLLKSKPSQAVGNRTQKKKFTRKNKAIISIRNKWGYTGVILLTPVLLSIPLGAFLAQKYYANRSGTLVYLSLSIVIWSFLISGLIYLV